MNIAENDLERKINDVIKWLQSKKQVRIQLDLRGRERATPERGVEMLEEIHEKLAPFGSRAKSPTKDNLSMVYNPKK